MLLHCFIALENLKMTQPLIDEDQKLALLHVPFTGTTLFRGDLANLQEANTKRANAITVFPPTAPPVSYSSRPHVSRGRNFNYSDRRGGYSRRAVAEAEDRAGPRQMPLSFTALSIDFQQEYVAWICIILAPSVRAGR